jgi:asparagine synthase (glutamine-hydrolysing)
MCGIAGEISWTRDVRDDGKHLKAMQQILARRGPDQDGLYVTEQAGLVHRRLAVIDLENGCQPMRFTQGDETYVLVYNGELYNTEEIRADLASDGYTFIGHSDTEVLLKAYMAWGEDCVNRFNGIFAFAIWKEQAQTLFIARDRIGVKPFFFFSRNGVFLFASELKALLCHPLVEPKLNENGVAEIMLLGPGRTPGCGVFQDVQELKAGQCGHLDKNRLRLQTYWELTDRPHTDSYEQTVEKVRDLVTDAIIRQLVSDVPVCTFLSGGLDSSIISALADKHFSRKGQQLHTFSISFKDNEKYFQAGKFQPNSDESYIHLMNDALMAKHHNVVVDTPELTQALFEAVDARDLPGMADVDASLLLFCREIKKQGTVALSGECADEIFGGYPWYTDPDVRARNGFPWAQSTAYRISFLHDDFAANFPMERYVQARYEKTCARASKLPGTSPGEARMKEMMKLNLDWFMQVLLDRKDRMSMYSGLEVRVPYCDYRIAEYLYSVPWEIKYENGVEKSLLRKAMSDVLPPEVLWRKKSPYPKTHHPAYEASVSKLLKELLEREDAPVFRLVKKESLQKLLTDQQPWPWYGQLMNRPQTIAYFLQVDYWLQKYNVKLV